MSASLTLPFYPAPSAPVALARGTAGALRPYQTTAVERIRAELVANRSSLLVMATGTGKTRVFGEIAAGWKGRVLVLAHRWELIKQARDRLAELTGEHVGVERAGMTSHGERIVCASKDSLHEVRLKGFEVSDFGLVIVDEAHHAVADTYQRILGHFEAAKVLGVTATPDRLDERALGQVFDSVAFVYEILDGINDGYLCPIRGETANVQSLDLSKLKANGPGGDLGDGQLGGVIGRDDVLNAICTETIRLAGNRRTILFFPTVETAHVASQVLNVLHAGCARAVDGTTADDTRASILRGHKGGEYQFLCNVGVLTEGYDDPAIACVGIARPTKSRALYAQMVGRGTRIADGKPDCLVLDYVGNAGRHALIGPEDLLGGKYDDAVVELAKKMAKEGGGRADENLSRAAKEIEDADRRRKAADIAKQAAAKTTWAKFDPFAMLGMKDPANDPWASNYQTPATPAQLGVLERAGISIAGEVSKSQATRLIGAIVARRNNGLATMKQIAALSKFGIPANQMYFSTASKVMDAIAENGWRRPSREALAALVGAGREPGEEG